MKGHPIHLKPNERLSTISKDRHVRKQQGRYLAYIVEDKFAQHVMLAQKLSALVEVINELVGNKPDQVSITGLYQIINSNGERAGGYSKHRWRVVPYALEEAAGAFESVRGGFQHAMVIGTKECYTTIRV